MLKCSKHEKKISLYIDSAHTASFNSPKSVNSLYLIIFTTYLFGCVFFSFSVFSSSLSCKQQNWQHKYCRHRPHPRQTITHALQTPDSSQLPNLQNEDNRVQKVKQTDNLVTNQLSSTLMRQRCSDSGFTQSCGILISDSFTLCRLLTSIMNSRNKFLKYNNKLLIFLYFW